MSPFWRSLAMPAALSLQLVLAGSILAGSVLAASAEHFETEEYAMSGGLECINAPAAYALGWTGKGVTVGVMDGPVRQDHYDLAGTMERFSLMDEMEPVQDWDTEMHGTHVAGLLAARRNAVGMHGVAFDAQLWVGEFQLYMEDDRVQRFFALHPEVRIYSNSWVLDHPLLFSPGEFEQEASDQEDFESGPLILPEVVESCLEHALSNPDTVFAFGAGNDGMTGSNRLPAALPRYVGNGRLSNWLSVSAVNSHAITRDEEGHLIVPSSALPSFTNLARGSELSTVMAPGYNLLAPYSRGDRWYCTSSGTSMATPLVSGTLALVAQAYPWMTGKQLADAVLTTASNDFVAPDAAVLYGSQENGSEGRVRLVLIDRDELVVDGTARTFEELQKDPNLAAQACLEILSRDPDMYFQEEVEEFLDAVVRGSYQVFSLTREEVFGQGILDAGKAVRGIARLDANRMTSAQVTEVPQLGTHRRDALETFDTRGFAAEFSNDITERQWQDRYHHPDFQTGGSDPALTEDALALQGRHVGLRKTGDGLLILSGTNTYEGATVVEEGVLAVARRSDGSGGRLEKSDVLVCDRGTLTGDGTIAERLVNDGVVRPGFAGQILSVGTYEQTGNGELHIVFDRTGQHGVLHAQDTLLAGDVLFQPREGQFYASSTSLVLEDFLTGSDPETAGFALAAARDTSPTLETELLGLAVSANDPGALSATVRVHRPADAYSRHARHAGAASLGRVLTRIAGTARGDMRHLLTALDWSAPDGSPVRDGLEALGPEAWDAAARASLAQQNEFNLLLLRRMLATARMTFAAGSSDRLPASQAAGRDGRRAAADWQFWASPCGSGTWQGSHGSTSSWKSTGTGLLAGADRFFESGITLGAHVALAARRTHVSDRHEAQIDTKSAFIGVQGLYAPDAWDGVWLTAQGRLGLESGEMDRTVSFNGYARHNESRWSGLAGSALLGAGRDWRWQREDSLASAGPLAFVEYSFAHRPGVEEQQGGASRLDVDDTVYDSLLLSLGAHAGWTTQLENGSGLGLDLLAA